MRCLAIVTFLAGLAAEDLAGPPLPVYSPAERTEILARADSLRLADDGTWLTLLHWAPSWRGARSQVDDERFFLAPGGKDDAKAELRATLAAILRGAGIASEAAAWRFPARLEFLVERLGLDRERLPVPGNAEFEDAVAGLGAQSAWLMFPSAYMNTPASMFGHTLVVIRSQHKSALLSQSVNYAAVTEESNGIIYALRGMAGLYPGYYSLMPYWRLVQEYGDIDQRDVWEYELDLTPAEIRRMLLHVWEMRDTWTRYFFFDENCSYNLLYLLDAARPGLDLRLKVGWWVIPLDTVRLVRETGMVKQCHFRPSRAARVRQLSRSVPPQARTAAHAIADGAAPATAVAQISDPVTRARTLDLASEYLQSLRGRKSLSQDQYQPRFFATMQERSTIAVPAMPDEEVPAPPRPDLGHPSGRVSLGGGVDKSGVFAVAEWRPAYHDLLDPNDGYLPGSQIEFTHLHLRWHEGRRPELERFDALLLRSFSIRDDFFASPSWTASIGIVRQPIADDVRRDAYGQLGVGGTWDLGRAGRATALVEAQARAFQDRPRYALGLGPAAYLYTPLGGRCLLATEVHRTWYLLGAEAANWEGRLGLRTTLARTFAVTASTSIRETWNDRDRDLRLRLDYFY